MKNFSPVASVLMYILGSDHIWIAVSAIVTAAMAWYTRALANETKVALNAASLQMEQAEIHHRQDLSPYVILNVRSWARFSEEPIIELQGEAINSGPAAATNIRLAFKIKGFYRRWSDQPFRAMIKPYSTEQIESQLFSYAEPSFRPDEVRLLSASMRRPLEIIVGVAYRDIFGFEGWTIYTSADDLRLDLRESFLPSEHLKATRQTSDTFEMAMRRYFDADDAAGL